MLESRRQIEDENNDEGEKENREPLRRAEPIRVARLAFMFSFATSPGSVKGTL